MKSKKIDLTDSDCVHIIQSLGGLLYKLNIQSADPLLDKCEEILTEDFCDSCESHKDECDCPTEHEMGGRYMREYDDGADYED